MTLDDKLKMAHEYAKIMLSSGLKGDFDFIDFKDIAVDAFTFVDEMEKQYNQRKEKGLPDALKDDWQPDWSKVPRSDVVGWRMKDETQAIWVAADGGYYLAPSFNYQGDWKQSLRKRPQQPKKEMHKCNCAHWKNSTCFMGDTFKCGECGGVVTI